MSPEAETTVHVRTPQDEYLIFACDGIWDVMSNEQCTQYFREACAQVTREQACEALLDECLHKKSRDNMTIVLVDLNPDKQ